MLILTKAAGLLLSPPGIIILLALLGWLVHLRSAFFGNLIVGLAIVALLVLSAPLVGTQLLATLERQHPPLPVALGPEAAHAARAIVVLGAGRASHAPEYGSDTVNARELERLRYAARLQRATGLPILLSGGAPFAEELPEAELMQQALREDFQIKAKWIETRSRTTAENAAFTKAILDTAGIGRVYLVTHAWHMPRAVWAFEDAGIGVVPAPTGFTIPGRSERTVLGYLPSAAGLEKSSRALHERLGLWWYRWNRREAVQPAAAGVAR